MVEEEADIEETKPTWEDDTQTKTNFSRVTLAASKRTNDHLKARIANLEKTYEVTKSKLEISDQTLEKEKAERNKYQEDYYRIKSKKSIIEKENKDLKDKVTELQNLLSQAQLQINSIEKESARNLSKQFQRSPDQELKVHDLDDSNEYDSGVDEIPERNTVVQIAKSIKESQPKKKTPKKLKSFSKASVETDLKVVKVSKDETNLFIDINSLLLSTLNLTLPIMFETDNNEFDDANSSFVSLQSKGLLDHSTSRIMDLYNCSPNNIKDHCIIDNNGVKQNNEKSKIIKFGEIFYPAFNKLTPRLLEGIYICNELADSNKNIQSIFCLTWDCIWFAFSSQILQKLVDSFSFTNIPQIKQKDQDMFDFNLDESKQTEYRKHSPIDLEFPVLTAQLKRRLKEINTKSKFKGIIEKFNKDSIVFPIYSLFRDRNVHDVIIESILNIIYPKSTIDEKDTTIKAEVEDSERLRNNSKLKKSINKPIVKEENKQVMLERKDLITLRMKVTAFCIVNTLSTNYSHILKMMTEIHDIIDSDDSSLYQEAVNCLLELNGIYLIVLNMLSEKLVEEASNILIKLIFDFDFKDKLIEQLIQPNMFRVIKQATFKYIKNRELFKQIIIIQQRISLSEPIKLREYTTSDYVELLNNQLIFEQNNEREELIINTLNNLLKNIQ